MLNQGGIVRVTLCPSCLNATTCVDRAIRGYDVLFCDMFEDSGQMKTGDGDIPAGEKKYVLPGSKAVKKKSKTVLKGLCQNCVKRDTCALPRPKTGVWHCEEFEEIP